MPNGRGFDRITINHSSTVFHTVLIHAYQTNNEVIQFHWCWAHTHTHILCQNNQLERDTNDLEVLVAVLRSLSFRVFLWAACVRFQGPFYLYPSVCVFACFSSLRNDKCSIKLCAHFDPSICRRKVIRFWMMDAQYFSNFANLTKLYMPFWMGKIDKYMKFFIVVLLSHGRLEWKMLLFVVFSPKKHMLQLKGNFAFQRESKNGDWERRHNERNKRHENDVVCMRITVTKWKQTRDSFTYAVVHSIFLAFFGSAVVLAFCAFDVFVCDHQCYSFKMK